MIDIPATLANELSLQPWQVTNTLILLDEGGTIPFIARYRKERTGEMNEIVLRDLVERYGYLQELEARKTAILASIEEQGKLTDELRGRIETCMQKNELEDLYLPYRPKRRTRATIAREKGLEPLAMFIRGCNISSVFSVDLAGEAEQYISEELGVATADEALAGASDILAEEIAENADYRGWLRSYFLKEGVFVSRVKDGHPEGSTKYEMYRDYRAPVASIAPHNMLALRRGENEGVLFFDLVFDIEQVLAYLEAHEVHSGSAEVRGYLKNTIADSFDRLMKHTIIGEARLEKKQQADAESIRAFAENLRELLLASPAGMKPTLGVDPGFRTGCKVVAVDSTGKFLEYTAIFPHQSNREREAAAEKLKSLIARHGIELVAIGNGTAGRETDSFVGEVLSGIAQAPVKIMVNESGASIYSASDVAIEEFPDLDITVRGAISIGRRLQDPLAELVKIDPKSIGVGQYQHDVEQKLLRSSLDDTVESCVNYVGVNLNTASRQLLRYVAGLSPAVAGNIVAWRNENGAFRSRKQLLKVPRFGPKAFEQAAGFLRIRDGENPLDNTAVHPESYEIVEAMAKDLGVQTSEITRVPEKLRQINLARYRSDTVGEPTLRDILAELEKPGRDPRETFSYAQFKDGVNSISDLSPGMELEGVVTNVANFGAFVDIGVHQDGLVHISQLADRFVNDPRTVVKVGQVVRVRVLEVNEKLQRISLSMKKGDSAPPPKTKAKDQGFSLDDLKSRFNS